LFQRCPEGVVQRILGAVEVAEQADQSRQDPARFRAVNGVYHFAQAFGASSLISAGLVTAAGLNSITEKL
jgi:hypothetical protein